MEALPGEPTGANSGIALQLLHNMYMTWPDADWFVISDDDTLLVPSNLAAYLSTLNPSDIVMKGKCVTMEDEHALQVVAGSQPEGSNVTSSINDYLQRHRGLAPQPLRFVVGGAGMVFSRELAKVQSESEHAPVLEN